MNTIINFFTPEVTLFFSIAILVISVWWAFDIEACIKIEETDKQENGEKK